MQERLLEESDSSNNKEIISNSDKQANNEEEDRGFHMMAYFIVLLQGVGLLLPWNIILNAIPYFEDLYCNAECQSDGKCPVAFFLTSAYVYPQLFLLLLMVFYGNRISVHFRILGSLIAQILCIALIPAVAPTSEMGALFLIFIIGLTTAVLQPSLFGFTSLLPPTFNKGLMSGQGVAGITAGIMQMIFKRALPNDNQTSAILYFTFAALILLSCVISYVYLLRIPFVKSRIASLSIKSKPSSSDNTNNTNNGSINGENEEFSGSAMDIEKAALITDNSNTKTHSIIEIVKKFVWKDALSVCNVFIMTFLVFPGVINQIPYRGAPFSSIHLSGWWFIILIFIFNVMDTLGRYLPGIIPTPKGNVLLFFTFARYAFVPLFIAAAQNWAPAFFNDLFVIFLMLAFSVTNGFLATSGMISGPMRAPPADREKAGFIMTFVLQLGILLGSQAAFGVSGGPVTSC